jgi:Secretion system C-terminal sorting domain
MFRNSTPATKCLLFVLVTFFAMSYAQAQVSSPKLSFASPLLISGTGGEKGATYKFSNVITGVDAYIKIEEINNGATLVNIDDSTLGYYDAWQPTIGGPGVYGTSSIEWSIEFKTTAGAEYSFPLLDLTAVDVDGDNGSLREFIDMSGQSSYDVPTVVPSLLTLSTLDDSNSNEGGGNSKSLHVLGPIANRTGIDTASLDVKMNYHFINQSKIKVTIGAEVDNNGYTGGIATDRYNSLYFKNTSNVLTMLPVTYRAFDAMLISNAVNVSWITENESGNDHFEVERSFDQKNFSTLGIVMDAQNNTGSSRRYSFKDAAPGLTSHTVIYYRLKQVDADGKFTYSTVKAVRTNAVSKAFIKVSPNPYMDRLNINFVSDAAGTADIRLINATGNLVKVVSSAISKGYNNVQLQNLSAQTAGMYIATISVNGNAPTAMQVVKQ